MSKIISVESYVDLNKVLVIYPFGKLPHFKTGKNSWVGLYNRVQFHWKDRL